MKNYWGNGGIARTFLTSALDGIQWSASRSGLFTTKENPLVPTGQEAGWAPEPVWTLWSWEESLAPVGNRIPAVQPVAHRYTDWAIPALPQLEVFRKNTKFLILCNRCPGRNSNWVSSEWNTSQRRYCLNRLSRSDLHRNSFMGAYSDTFK
jgi:hypothetical protein